MIPTPDRGGDALRTMGPYRTDDSTVRWIMGQVILALVPGAAASIWLYGPGVLLQCLLGCASAAACEALACSLRGRPVVASLGDLSAVLTALLLALSLPPNAPWWLVVAGSAFAILVAKHAYGGLGQNVFNPAMAGYAAMLVSFPVAMSLWPAPGDPWHHWTEIFHATTALDGISSATPLDALKTSLAAHYTVDEIIARTAFQQAESIPLTLAAAWLAGGAYLLLTRVITWHLPIAYLVAVAGSAAGLHLWDAGVHPGAGFQLIAGGVVFAAFFIVTDPVSGATTPWGKLWFGALAGVLTVLIRNGGTWNDGIAFAVLLANCAVPLIDAWTLPPPFGRHSSDSAPR